jgi:putative tryptophan/tyrosine transport system substrate-binding protein
LPWALRTRIDETAIIDSTGVFRMEFLRRRREFITLLGGAAAAWPLAARAQQADRMRRIGALAPLPAIVWVPFFEELARQGFVEGQNLAVDRRGFDASYDRFSAVAAELVSAAPDAIMCGGDAAIRAAQAATTSIPIVALTDDMVGAGLVRSLARPGANTTGVSILAADLDGKRQEVLIDFLPGARHLAALSDAQNNTPAQLQALLDAARSRGVELSIHRVERSDEIAPALDAAKAGGAAAVNVLASPLLHGNRHAIIMRTLELRMPAIYQWPDTAKEGGFLGYGPRFAEVFRLLARQLAKALRGANPADLPVEQPTKFELAVNERTAKAIGLDVSPVLLARADEVIE